MGDAREGDLGLLRADLRGYAALDGPAAPSPPAGAQAIIAQAMGGSA